MKSGEPPDVETPDDAASRERLGAELARLRKERRLTGEKLGGLVSMSQGKISKLERGALRPSPEDVVRIVRALGRLAPVDGDVEGDLVEQARRLRDAGPRHRSALVATGVTNQAEQLDAEDKATLVRNFEPIAVPGLLQISEYTRRLVNAYHAVTVGDAKAFWPHTAATVALRAKRQERLYDVSKKFRFVLLESVLGNRFATPGVMLAQVDRIEQAAALENVTIRIVRNTTELPYAPVYGINLLDEDVVITEAFEATVSHDPRTIGIYTNFFETYFELAEDHLSPILEHYKTIYADLARPRTDHDAAPSPEQSTS